MCTYKKKICNIINIYDALTSYAPPRQLMRAVQSVQGRNERRSIRYSRVINIRGESGVAVIARTGVDGSEVEHKLAPAFYSDDHFENLPSSHVF